ncbi:tetraacyldisaccharide 4'-kinase [Rhodoferax aquaticus]|uniref:Tetraacyldisaccharide 4'-kinase n=1 Tax=Rhodoferax aquaticus TaxID=2527691 RepID=A0A515EN05_9BURK|nr:tetraacyldisaccharide 4'-kinase [Rhodoferax aquaticus]QDL54049.1 tetraacyldisaccharide 4'-kinase [Rhodoferax aquaticus]
MAAAWVGAVEQTLLRAWTRRGALAWGLLPLTALYALLYVLRRACYRYGLAKPQRVDAVVLVVGNVVVGGAGKTPTTISIVEHLRARGLAIGVVSRGYGRNSDAASVEVLGDTSVDLAGDEPLLIKRSTGVPVFVARSRHAAACALLAQHPHTQVIVCDDGLQHYALYRDIEVCVFDDRGCGNGLLLPSGPLRERWPRRPIKALGQHTENLLVLNTGGVAQTGQFVARRSLAPYAIDRNGKHIPLAALYAPGHEPVMAVAGIARPERFFDMLRAQGVPLDKTLALPDHYDFSSWPPNIYEGYQLICTEKDALKLWQHAPHSLAVPLQQAAEPAFFDTLDSHIDSALRSRKD